MLQTAKHDGIIVELVWHDMTSKTNKKQKKNEQDLLWELLVSSQSWYRRGSFGIWVRNFSCIRGISDKFKLPGHTIFSRVHNTVLVLHLTTKYPLFKGFMKLVEIVKSRASVKARQRTSERSHCRGQHEQHFVSIFSTEKCTAATTVYWRLWYSNTPESSGCLLLLASLASLLRRVVDKLTIPQQYK